MGGLTRQRPWVISSLGQVGKCENPLDIYSQASTNGHLPRLTATLCRRTVQILTVVLITPLQRQRPQKRVRNRQNHISTTASFFQRLTKNSRMITKFDPYGSLVINPLVKASD